MNEFGVPLFRGSYKYNRFENMFIFGKTESKRLREKSKRIIINDFLFVVVDIRVTNEKDGCIATYSKWKVKRHCFVFCSVRFILNVCITMYG